MLACNGVDFSARKTASKERTEGGEAVNEQKWAGLLLLVCRETQIGSTESILWYRTGT